MKLALIIPGISGTIDAPSGVPTGSLFPQGQNILSVGIQFLIAVSIIFGFYMLLRAGINMITSGGDKERFEKGRERLRYAIIGILIIFFSFAIINLLAGFFGVPLIGSVPSGPTPGPFVSATPTPATCGISTCRLGERCEIFKEPDGTTSAFCVKLTPTPTPICGALGQPCCTSGSECKPGSGLFCKENTCNKIN